VGRLESYDAAHDSNLAETLRVYISTQHSLTRTAARLHVQPNTVSYRLDRMAAITGYNPRDPNGMLMLSIGAYICGGQTD
jgi:DNA-binding PucR family transcriptional regulator